MGRYFFYDAETASGAPIDSDDLDAFTERHRFHPEVLPPMESVAGPVEAIVEAHGIEGQIISSPYGVPSRGLLRSMGRAIRMKQRLFIYWPTEGAVELVDDIRLRSFWAQWVAQLIMYRVARYKNALRAFRQSIIYRVGRYKNAIRVVWQSMYRVGRYKNALRVIWQSMYRVGGQESALQSSAVTHIDQSYTVTHIGARLACLLDKAAPVAFVAERPSPTAKLDGRGVYLRTDFWAPILSGGSYGHTVYQGKALAATTRDFLFILANRFPLLDQLGHEQLTVRPNEASGSELAILDANDHYEAALRPLFEYLKPAFIYERACLGNFVGALLSRELNIPYFLEYNGSEISMKRSFDSSPYQYEDLFIHIERFNFAQATAISVVSQVVKDGLVERGVPAEKILVNWNAVDLEAYKRPDDTTRVALRAELGFREDHHVVCFTGTFGGWHGIDVLAPAMAEICRRNPKIRFLLIGDGHFKKVVHEVVAKHKLHEKVCDVGRVQQAEGARLMGAADTFIAPHSSHMVDSKFFGSPTKLFEYMGFGVGIIASDLEQIGEVVTPALRIDAGRPDKALVTNERGILCTPGDLNSFVEAVCWLADNPEIGKALGENALSAARDHYTWDRHVDKFWKFVHELPHSAGAVLGKPETTDACN